MIIQYTIYFVVLYYSGSMCHYNTLLIYLYFMWMTQINEEWAVNKLEILCMKVHEQVLVEEKQY